MKVFIIDDSKDFCLLLKESIEKAGHSVEYRCDAKNISKHIDSFGPDIILLDVVMPNISGLDILKDIKGLDPNLPIIMISAQEEPSIIVKAIKAGASDYIPKTISDSELIEKIEKLHEINNIKKTESELRINTELVGTSYVAKNLINMISTISQSDIPVFIRGESGTGKSMFAEMIHRYSKRSNKPFVVINCPAIPPTLLESELFGHEQGSFTGAIKRVEGKFEAANGGTVFLDEIGSLDLDLQAKILRVIQTKDFERVGGTKTMKADIRIMAATNRDVEKAVQKGLFREDLYYRLNVLPIYIPPLRERKDDVSAFAHHFLKVYSIKENKEFKDLSNEIIDLLRNYDWPGNIRELSNVMARAVVLGKAPELKASDLLIPSTLNSKKDTQTEENTELTSLKEMEKKELIEAIRKSSGNVSQAAKLLGISRVALYRRMKKHNIGLKS